MGLRSISPIALVACIAVPTTSFGQAGDEVLQLAEAEQSSLPPDAFTGGLSFGGIGEDLYLTLALGLTFERDQWGVGVQLPLRFRILDKDPQSAGDYGGLLREEDWDEVADFLRVIRFVYVGQRDKKGPYYVRIGELSNLTVGYGTIMHRYHNGLDAHRWHTGVDAVVNIDAYGGEAFIGDLLDPYVAGLRFTARPFTVAWGEGWWDMFVAGANLMTDSRAPFELSTSADPAMPQGPRLLNVDDNGVPIVSRERALVILGLDVGAEVVQTDLLSITPYMALNKMSVVDNGWGWHLGVLWHVQLPLLIDTLVADVRTEYQRVSGDYRGPYFNTVYEIERFQLLESGGGSAQPKLRYLCGASLDCSTGTPGGKNGVFFDFRVGLPNWVFVGGEYIDYDGGENDGTLRMSLEVPALEFVDFSAFYYRINVAGTNDLFKIDDRSAIVAQAVVPITWLLSAQVRWWRIWEPGPTGYESVDDWSIGLGFRLEL